MFIENIQMQDVFHEDVNMNQQDLYKLLFIESDFYTNIFL